MAPGKEGQKMTTDCSHHVVRFVVRFSFGKFRVPPYLTTRLQIFWHILCAHESNQKICSHVVTYSETLYNTLKKVTTNMTTARLHNVVMEEVQE